MATLDTRLVDVVGDKTAKELAKALDLHTVEDLIRHFPFRITDRGSLSLFSELREGQDATVVGEVYTSKMIPNRNGGYRVAVVVRDDSGGKLNLTFFANKQYMAEFQLKRFRPGVRGLFAGTVGWFNNQPQLAHPEFEPLDDEDNAGEVASMFVSIYPTSGKLRIWTIARAVSLVLQSLDPLPDPLPSEIRARHKLLDYDTAIRSMHRPDSSEHWWAARRRLAFDEAFGVQLVLARRRADAAAHATTARPGRSGGILDAFDARLPFTLTDGQQAVGEEIAHELAGTTPMQRLLQGEVGSGKTIVALRAMLQVVDSGGQAALLAPTEVLAAQHLRSIEDLLGDLGQGGLLGGADDATRVALLTGSQPAGARKAALLDAAGGAAGIVIGTHALLEQHVQFADLGLVVIDEQHRFGVEQRDALRAKGQRPPHVLVMTATPIPRTVAMTVFGDLDVSTLAELPRGRSPITTSVVPSAEKPAWLERAWSRVREEVSTGRQVFVVCPRIGDGLADESMDEPPPDEEGTTPRRAPLAVLDLLPRLESGPLAGLRVAPLHGQMAADDKDRTMRAFAAGEIDVLVATTVVEVGVDVPNASVMVVMDADRFGVSQLHQLRGRIGRGAHAGLCLLVTEAQEGTPARDRLDAVAATTDGFELARLDLEQRREGDVLGSAQSGRRRTLRMLSLLRDEKLILAARDEATSVIESDPTLAAHPSLAAMVAQLQAAQETDYLEKS